MLFSLDFLQAPKVWDEHHFWETSLSFSNRPIPGIEELRNYDELSTPLPFIIFGALEYLFQQGIFAGRLLNLILSLIISFLIGWPSRRKGGKAVLCMVGLFMCPYYLGYGLLLYTDIIACFFALLGFVAYTRKRHLLSSLAFILAISSRQYLLAFPAAIATYEFLAAIIECKRIRQFRLTRYWKWLIYLIATLSIFGWIYLFQGLAPSSGIEVRKVPEVQQTTWAVTLGGAINFLAFVGTYIVIPELILFRSGTVFQIIREQKGKIILIAAALLLFCFWFPPLLFSLGTLIKLANFLPNDILKIAFFYSLSLLACIRFSQPSLMTLIVLFNSIIMIKAYPWDKYVLPLAIIFWYLKSLNFEKRLGNVRSLSYKDSNAY